MSDSFESKSESTSIPTKFSLEMNFDSIRIDDHSSLLDLTQENILLESKPAEERLSWIFDKFPEEVIVTSSFGAQSAILLHMVSVQSPNVPIVVIDTGYLFPETYKYIDDLSNLLNLNLKIYCPKLTSKWLETRHGKLWETVEGLDLYGRIVKQEPLLRAVQELRPKAWITGLRRNQSSTRQHLDVLDQQDGVIKVHPILDWTDEQVAAYFKKYSLPPHPLVAQGYVSIGDQHSSAKVEVGKTAEDTRFNGMKRECGLHTRARSFQKMESESGASSPVVPSGSTSPSPLFTAK